MRIIDYKKNLWNKSIFKLFQGKVFFKGPKKLYKIYVLNKLVAPFYISQENVKFNDLLALPPTINNSSRQSQMHDLKTCWPNLAKNFRRPNKGFTNQQWKYDKNVAGPQQNGDESLWLRRVRGN